MAKREYVQLAHDFDPRKNDPSGMFMSEKLDGFRVFWDAGTSTGFLKTLVPWANNTSDERFTEEQYSTGLWTRYGNIVHAPSWWLAKLPPFPCDGELYMGRGTFQKLRSIASKLPKNRVDSDWRNIQYYVFDIPSVDRMFADGSFDLRTGNKISHIQMKDAYYWFRTNYPGIDFPVSPMYETAYSWLQANLHVNDAVVLHEQYRLPFSRFDALELMNSHLSEITGAKGEGLIIRQPKAIWTPERVHDLLKVKKLKEAEAVVTGYWTGKETDHGSQHLGRLGSLMVTDVVSGQKFKLGPFKSEDRVLTTLSSDLDEAYSWAYRNPDSEAPEWIVSDKFPRGTIVTYTYRELTNDGKPKEARFLRIWGVPQPS